MVCVSECASALDPQTLHNTCTRTLYNTYTYMYNVMYVHHMQCCIDIRHITNYNMCKNHQGVWRLLKLQDRLSLHRALYH